MPHCCKSYVDVQIQLTAETQLGNVALRFALSERQFAIVMQSRIDYKANIFLLEVPGPKRIQMLFWDILVGDLTQQAVFFVLCISLTNLNAFSVLHSFTMLQLR